MTTLVEVARKAGVSKSTVSNVIHGRIVVAEPTRMRVERAIGELGYRPNGIARSLRVRASNTIGMIVPDLGNPFHAQLAVAVERAATELGYATLVVHTDCTPDVEAEVGRALFDRRVDGIVIAGLSIGSEMPASLLNRNIPVVLASFDDSNDQRLGVVDHDDATAMEDVVNHLLGLGHRRIAFVSQDFAEQSGERRRRGFEIALRARKLSPARFESATAYVAHNDMLAIHTIDRLELQGRQVPRDASVVGYDDIPLAAHSRIQLTTVKSDARLLGKRAAELVTAAARSGRHVSFREKLESPLIIRNTTGVVPR